MSISSTFYVQLLFVQFPKVQKNIEKLTVFFVLSGSLQEKVAHRMLMKLTPGCHIFLISVEKLNLAFLSDQKTFDLTFKTRSVPLSENVRMMIQNASKMVIAGQVKHLKLIYHIYEAFS